MFTNNCQIVQIHTIKGKGMLSEINGVRQTSAKKRERERDLLNIGPVLKPTPA
jgi:hypothetical protein